MTPEEKKRNETQYSDFVRTAIESGLRFSGFDLGEIPAAILIDDRKPENIVVKAHIPGKTPTDIGHVFATGRGGKFEINDIYVETKYYLHEIRSKLMEGLISGIEKFNPSIIKGHLKIEPGSFPALSQVFQKFQFTVSLEPDDYMSIFREYPDNLKEKTKNQ
jgi:hypothetical protein